MYWCTQLNTLKKKNIIPQKDEVDLFMGDGNKVKVVDWNC